MSVPMLNRRTVLLAAPALAAACSIPAFAAGSDPSRIKPKWVPPGEWINYSPPLVLSATEHRPADRGEAVLAKGMALIWRKVTRNYSLRLPLVGPGCYVSCDIRGDCMGQFLPEGSVCLVDQSIAPKSGDTVLVEWDDKQMQAFARGAKYRPKEYARMYGDEHARLAVKLFGIVNGESVLMNSKQALHYDGGSRILGVVRHVEIDGKPVYGSSRSMETSQ